MKFLEVINELVSGLGLGEVFPDDTGSITLLFDWEHEVSFVPEEDGVTVIFQCEVGDTSHLTPNEYKALLEASFSKTDKAAFAIHPVLEKVILWKHYGEFTSKSELEKAINDFLMVAITWKKRLESGNFNITPSSESHSIASTFSGYFIKA